MASPPASPQKSTAPPPLIAAGSHVVVQKVGGEHIRVCRLRPGQKVSVEKLQFDPAAAVGQRFGMFEVCQGQLKPVEAPKSGAEETNTTLLSSMIGGAVTNSADKIATVGDVSLPGDSYDSAATTTTSSSAVEISIETVATATIAVATTTTSDTAANPQRLTHCEIEALKKREGGVRTAELVSRLVDGNRAFAERTTFSQQKYVQKKAKKHSDVVVLSRPTLRLLCECHYRPNPDKVANLRMDILALMLQLSAIHHGSRVLVFEQVMGLLVSGVVERLGGAGTCIHLHQGNVAQSVPTLGAMEFNEELSTMRPLSIATLLSDTADLPNAESNGAKNDNAVTSGEPAKKRSRMESEREAMEMMVLANGGGVNGGYGSLDSVMLAIKNVSAVDVLEHVYASLRLSGTVVIYSSVQKHVLLAYDWLKERGAVQVQLMEQSQRLHQVLEGRTHPLMHQAIAGGYLLSAIKVKPKEPSVNTTVK